MLGAVVTSVFDAGAPPPGELRIAHVCEHFHISASEYDAHDLRYNLWYSMMAQERMARQVQETLQGGKGLGKTDEEWLTEWYEFIPPSFSSGD